ncbi:MAG: hypothetical protein M1834_006719 [Cirrosporium novae-zelandiae]|nr:MAG: hypothetical protein M1834_006719 [Cirrosporium novae-zelandiae]
MSSSPPASLAPRIVAVSSKMYFSIHQTEDYLSTITKLPLPPSLSLIFLPTFLSLQQASQTLATISSPILLGAQDCATEDYGAYTGCVSPADLASLSIKIVEIGHAERRRFFAETDPVVAEKAKAVVRNNMIPLVCIGEKTHSSIASEAVGKAVSEIVPQVKAVLEAIPETSTIIFAYEPVWAIGAQHPASSDHVVSVIKEVRKLFAGRKGETRVLYGGSAGPGVWEGLKSMVDGLFLGRFSHNIDNLKKTIEEVGSA